MFPVPTSYFPLSRKITVISVAGSSESCHPRRNFRHITMKRTRSYKEQKPKMPEPETSRSHAPLRISFSDELIEENNTSMHTETETQRTGNGKMEINTNTLGQMIASVIKEMSKETGGLANLSRSLVTNTISNEQMGKPHANMELEGSKSLRHQNSEYKEAELKAALAVIKKTMDLDAADPFNTPVDPVALELPDYFDVIKTPMDFGTICSNLENGLKYMNLADVFKDVQYIWYNCVIYNKKGDPILELMKRVKTFFMKNWKAVGLHTEQPPVADILPYTKSSMLRHNKRQKENQVDNDVAQLQQKEAGSNQAGHSQQSSCLPESSPEKDETNIATPVIRRGQGHTRCVKLSSTTGRMKIGTNELGQPVGPEAQKLTSFLGVTARDGNLAPLIYPTWSKVPEQNKEDMWQKVLTRFDIDPSCRSWVLMSLANKWRNFKAGLKSAHYDTHATDEERLADCDTRVLPDQWSVLVSHWSSDKFQRISAQNKANRAKVRFVHTSGTKSFARIIEEERAKMPVGEEPSQADLFILTHTDKNGQPVDEKTASVISQLRESATQDEAYNQIMGEYTKGGVSLSGSNAKVFTRAEPLRMVKENNAEVVEMKERLASVEQTCSQMASQMSAMMSMMATMHKGYSGANSPNDFGTSVPVGTPNQSEPASTSNHEVPAKQTRGRKKRR